MIRSATPDDAEALLAIYAPLVERTAVSFETAPPAVEEMRARIAATLAARPWLVRTGTDGAVEGYAYASRFRERAAYDRTVEVSVYVAAAARRRGVARSLYPALFDELTRRGFRRAIATIALPNPASVALHEGFGFEPVGVLRGVGFKLGRWWDVGLWQRPVEPG